MRLWLWAEVERGGLWAKMAQRERGSIFRFSISFYSEIGFCCLINISGALKIRVQIEGSI